MGTANSGRSLAVSLDLHELMPQLGSLEGLLDLHCRHSHAILLKQTLCDIFLHAFWQFDLRIFLEDGMVTHPDRITRLEQGRERGVLLLKPVHGGLVSVEDGRVV